MWWGLGGEVGEMTQTLYAHMNKIKIKKKKKETVKTIEKNKWHGIEQCRIQNKSAILSTT
jgi:hypothetical protein